MFKPSMMIKGSIAVADQGADESAIARTRKMFGRPRCVNNPIIVDVLFILKLSVKCMILEVIDIDDIASYGKLLLYSLNPKF